MNQILSFRPMQAADVVRIAEIESEIYEFPWTATNFYDSLAAGNISVVGEIEGEIVIYGILLLGRGEGELLNISVAHSMQRKGYGTKLVWRFCNLAKRYGAEQLFLEVRVSNLSAIEFYRCVGFTEVGRRKGYYPAASGREDALVMHRALADTPIEEEFESW